jgi:hypothetical protein
MKFGVTLLNFGPGGNPEHLIRSGRLLEVLQSLATEHVLLDSYAGMPTETRSHERSWHMLATIADRVLDLGHCALC